MVLTLIVLLCTGSTSLQSQDTRNIAATLRQIDDKARAVHGTDPEPITQLVDAVMASHDVSREMMELGGRDFRRRLIQAECEFHGGKRSGVSESTVASLVNQLADRFQTPDFTRTSAREIHFLRIQMLYLHPSFTGIEARPKTHDKNWTLGTEMSPLEALHVTATMAYQKVYNPEWQLPPEQRERMLSEHSPVNRPHPPSGNSKSSMVISAVRQTFTQMSIRDLLSIAERSFSVLGI